MVCFFETNIARINSLSSLLGYTLTQKKSFSGFAALVEDIFYEEETLVYSLEILEFYGFSSQLNTVSGFISNNLKRY